MITPSKTLSNNTQNVAIFNNTQNGATHTDDDDDEVYENVVPQIPNVKFNQKKYIIVRDLVTERDIVCSFEDPEMTTNVLTNALLERYESQKIKNVEFSVNGFYVFNFKKIEDIFSHYKKNPQIFPYDVCESQRKILIYIDM